MRKDYPPEPETLRDIMRPYREPNFEIKRQIPHINEVAPAFFQNRIALNVSEAALVLGVSQKTLERLIKNGEIGVKRVGRRVLISRDELGTWLNQKE